MTTTIPSTMTVAVYRSPRVVELEDRPLDPPGPGEVLAEVAYCGVCGSDVHFIIDGWATPGSVHGHEWSGRVVAVGEGVTEWATGDLVVGGPAATCGECRGCRAGRPNLCTGRDMPGVGESYGAFAEYRTCHPSELVRIPDGLDLRTAALAEPLAVALHALSQGRAEAGERVFVSGAGPIGSLVIAALRARGIDDITVSEPNEVRRELAARLGATRLVTPADLDVPPMWEPMRVIDGAVDVAFECSGKGVATETALAQLDKMGRLVLVGAGIDAPEFILNRILLNELEVTGAFEYDARGVDDAVALLAGGALPAADLLEPGEVGLSDLVPTLERLAAGEIAGKVLVAPALT